MLHCSFYLEKPFQWYTHLLCEELQDEMYYICHSYPCIHWIYKIDPKFVIFGKMILSNILINRYRLILLYIEENQLQIYEYLSLLCFFLGMFILHLFVIISCNSLRVTKVCFIDTKIFGFDVIYWAIYSYLQLLCVTWI